MSARSHDRWLAATVEAPLEPDLPICDAHHGFGWHRGARPPTSEELVAATRPYYERTITAFGVDRCMFESNFPVDRESCSYTVLWNAFKRMTAGCTATEKSALFHDTAARVYRVGSTTSATRDSHCCDAAHPHTHD